jgi:hypothetical protein
MLADADGKEEILADSGLPLFTNTASASKKSGAKEIKAFEFTMDEKGLSVPGFRWKTKDGMEKLQTYADGLQKLLEKIEDRLTKPD